MVMPKEEQWHESSRKAFDETEYAFFRGLNSKGQGVTDSKFVGKYATDRVLLNQCQARLDVNERNINICFNKSSTLCYSISNGLPIGMTMTAAT